MPTPFFSPGNSKLPNDLFGGPHIITSALWILAGGALVFQAESKRMVCVGATISLIGACFFAADCIAMFPEGLGIGSSAQHLRH